MHKIISRYKLLFLIFALIVALESDFIMFDLIDKVDSATGKKFHLGYIRNHVVKLYESFNPFVGKFALDQYSLPIFKIELNQKAVNKLAKMLKDSGKTLDFRGLPYSSSRNKVWVKCKIGYGNDYYKAKISFHGSDSINFRNDKKSLAIKLKKDKLLNHMRRFSLIILEEASVAMIFSYKLQEWLTGFKLNSYFVRVSVNGVDQGVFLLEEKAQKSLLEKNGLSGVDIIKPIDEWDTQYSATHEIPFNWNIANTTIKVISKKYVGQLIGYEKMLQCSNFECLRKYIDYEKMANEEALRVLFGTEHMLTGDNQKILYDTTIGKMWTYFRTEDALEPISYFFDKNLYFANSKYKNKLIYLLGQDEDFRAKRNKVLWHLVMHKDKIIKMFDKIYKNSINVILADSNHYTNGRFIRYMILKKRKNLISNLNILKKYLEYARSYTYVKFITPNKMQLIISADSNSPIKIDYIKFDFKGNNKIKITSLDDNKTVITTFNELDKYFNNKRFMIGFDANYNLVEHRHKFIIEFDKNTKVLGFYIDFINNITGKKIPKYHNFKKFIPYATFMDPTDHLILDGYYEINKTIVTNSLSIKAGSRIKLAPKVSILTKKLSILGTSSKPVVISNMIKGRPFGVIAAVGNKQDEITIEHLELFGGKDAMLNGSYFSGGLSLYNHKKVTIKNSFIHHNSADDGLNIKNSQVFLKNNIFNANKADQVDLDFCQGVIENNRFLKHSILKHFSMIKIPIDDNGDGLDLSGSKIIIKNNKFIGFLDKGNSIGEETTVLITNNVYKNNRSAITVKDSSKVYIANNRYKNNKFDIELYQKKQIFDYPSIFNINEKHKIDKIRNIKSHFFVLSEDLDITNLNTIESLKQLKNKKWKQQK